MKKFEINGVKFEVDYNKPLNDQVYCISYDVSGEYKDYGIIDTPNGRVVVNQFDVPWFGIISVGISEEKVYQTMYQEVV